MSEMSAKEIESVLIAEVANILMIDPATVTVDAPLHSLGMNSMAFVELLVVIEKTFGLKLVETDLTKDDFQAIENDAATCRKVSGRSEMALPWAGRFPNVWKCSR